MFFPFYLFFHLGSNLSAPRKKKRFISNDVPISADKSYESKDSIFVFLENGKLNDEVFSQSEFETYAEQNLVLVRLDFPRNIQQSNETKMYNNSLAQRYGIQGFPTILVFDNQGKMVAKTGYQPGGATNYVSHIQSFL